MNIPIWVALILVGMMISPFASSQGIAVAKTDKGRFLQLDNRTLLELSSPWIATSGYQSLYYFPGGASASGSPAVKNDNTEHGKWTETITPAAESLTIRYDFDLTPDPKASHLQWVWRLEPANWNGIAADGAEGSPEKPFALHTLEGLRVENLKRMDFVLSDVDLSVTCKSSDGMWSFRDEREAEWAKCYRLEFNRDIDSKTKRTGWIEVTIHTKKAVSPLVALTTGTTSLIQRIPFQSGPLREIIDQKLNDLVFIHSVSKTVPRGDIAGEVDVIYADGQKITIPIRSEESFSSPTDDPHSVGNGRYALLADKTPAWLSQWHNPRPTVSIKKLEARSLTGGWRLIAASGTASSADTRRAAAVLHGDSSPLAEESVISLDGKWQFSADKIEPREIPVPAFMDQQSGLYNVHEGTYTRDFDIPDTFSGRRVAIHFDAVGDAAEVWVNGKMAGQRISPALPFEMDITGLVSIPSTGNKLEVRVKDDSHFSIPYSGEAWRNGKSWIPRGMGSNNRKGLYQSVTLRARPVVQISDVRIQTSVRTHELIVTYSILNTGKAVINAQIIGSVHPNAGGATVMTLPAVKVELPGYVTTHVTVKAPFTGVELWQPDHPTLYSLRSLLMDGDKRLERVDTRFGFREVWFEGKNFYLNGIRCNLRGESPAYSEKAEMMATRKTASEMIRKYQQMNFNVLRFHSMPAPPHVLDLCDELGMMVIDESGIYASWQLLMPEHPDWMENCRQHLTNWVRRDRNHPAVVLWSAENEGLNVSLLSPGQLGEYRKMIDAEDGSRPVIFDGDGTGMGASPASEKHYVTTISDLKNLGGVSSGYARDLRNDIYWATEYKQEQPLGCGEFLFPYEPGLKDKEREVCYMMGLQTRGYRLADWYDIRPYNPSYIGFLKPEGVRAGYEAANDIVQKSFAPVAVFDKAYDALGPFPAPPVLEKAQPVTRELIVYNDTFAGENVEVEWSVTQGDKKTAGERLTKDIPLGGHIVFPIKFTPTAVGELKLDLISRRAEKKPSGIHGLLW